MPCSFLCSAIQAPHLTLFYLLWSVAIKAGECEQWQQTTTRRQSCFGQTGGAKKTVLGTSARSTDQMVTERPSLTHHSGLAPLTHAWNSRISMANCNWRTVRPFAPTARQVKDWSHRWGYLCCSCAPPKWWSVSHSNCTNKIRIEVSLERSCPDQPAVRVHAFSPRVSSSRLDGWWPRRVATLAEREWTCPDIPLSNRESDLQLASLVFIFVTLARNPNLLASRVMFLLNVLCVALHFCKQWSNSIN